MGLWNWIALHAIGSSQGANHILQGDREGVFGGGDGGIDGVIRNGQVTEANAAGLLNQVGAIAARGIRIVNVVPSPGSESRVIIPR